MEMLHPLEARFVKLAIVKQLLKPSQVHACQQRLLKEQELGQRTDSLRIERYLLESELLTPVQACEIWEELAQAQPELRLQIEAHLRSASRLDDNRQLEFELHNEPQEPPLQIDGFEIQQRIGRGGMGTVYKARQLNMDREVAIKVLPVELAKNERYVRRFVREAHAAGKLDHGNLVRVYDVGVSRGRYYIAMEYVEGQTVKRMLARQGRLPVLESLRIVEQVAVALDCAHTRKIIHRDIKPDNIMLSTRGVAKLCDLGLAKVLDDNSRLDSDTQAGHAMGTPYYMSPEQARAQGELDPRSDLYSLGATLYHMVTGTVPFDGQTPLDVLLRVNNEPPLPPDIHEPLLPPPVTELILQLLEKEPQRRPQHAEEVRKRLTQIRCEMEAGRVYFFSDAGRFTHQVNKSAVQNQPLIWYVGTLSAALFLLLASWFTQQKTQDSPLPVQQFFVADTVKQKPPERTPSQSIELQSAPPVAYSAPPSDVQHELPDRNVSNHAERWRARLNTAEGWRSVLYDLNDSAQQLKDEPELQALYRQALAHRENFELRQFEGAKDAMLALARAGYFQRAARMHAEVKREMQSACAQQKLQALAAQLEAVQGEWQRSWSARFEALLDAGLLQLATARLETYRAILHEDQASEQSFFKLEEERLNAVRQSQLDRLDASRQEGLQLDAALTRIHSCIRQFEFTTAASLISDYRQHFDAPQQLAVLNFEEYRLQLILEYFEHVRRTIERNPKLIGDEILKDGNSAKNKQVSGLIVSMNEKSIRSMIGPRGEVEFPLARISRDALRNLFNALFYEKRYAVDDLAGRIAFDLDDPQPMARQQARKRLIAFAGQDKRAARLLELLMNAENGAVASRVQELLAQAEVFTNSGDYKAAWETVLVARLVAQVYALTELQRSALSLQQQVETYRRFSATFGALWHDRDRFGEVLQLQSEDLCSLRSPWKDAKRAGLKTEISPQGGVHYGGSFTQPVELHWQLPLQAPAQSSLELKFPDNGPARLELEIESSMPDTHERGALAPEAQRWQLWMQRKPDGLRVGLQTPGGGFNGTAQEIALEHTDRLRLWMRLELDRVSFGVGDKTYGICEARHGTQLRPLLRLSGKIAIYGLHMAGTIGLHAQEALEEKQLQQALDEIALLNPGELDALYRLHREFGHLSDFTAKISAHALEWLQPDDPEFLYWVARKTFNSVFEQVVLHPKLREWFDGQQALGPLPLERLEQGLAGLLGATGLQRILKDPVPPDWRKPEKEVPLFEAPEAIGGKMQLKPRESNEQESEPQTGGSVIYIPVGRKGSAVYIELQDESSQPTLVIPPGTRLAPAPERFPEAPSLELPNTERPSVPPPKSLTGP